VGGEGAVIVQQITFPACEELKLQLLDLQKARKHCKLTGEGGGGGGLFSLEKLRNKPYINTYRGRHEIGGVRTCPLSWSVYTETLYVMVNRVKGDGRAPFTLTSQG
jgi:hypothetical protein